MPTHCDIARPAKQVCHEPIDAAQCTMMRQTPDCRPAPTQSNHNPSRRMPSDLASQSLPQTLWLSDVAEFSAPPPLLSRPFPGFGKSLRAGSTSSGSLSDSGQPSSRTLQRPPSRDYLLSASPTRSVALSISGSHPRHHTPSPVPSSHPLHSSRSFGAVTPHRSSASSVHAGGHLDLKRLMSKPAMQTSTASTSLMHDSERSPRDPSSSRVDHPRYPTDNSVSRPPLSRSADPSRERTALNVNTVGLRSSSAPRHGHTSSPERREPSGDSQTGKPSRNVLRRRPSARSNPSTPTVSNFRPGTENAITPPPRSTSIKQPDSGVPFISPPIPSATSPNIRGLQAPTPPRTKTPHIPHVPVGLTPAGAVALAYKQQEQRREELAETASFNEAYQPSSTDKVKSAHPERLASSGAESGESTGGPYYTVFGGETGRLVAVGGPEDDWHYGFESRATMTSNAKASTRPGSRSLTRKVSGSLKKVAGSIKRGEREHQRELPASSGDEWKPYDGSKPAPTRDPSTSSQSRLVSRTPSKTSLKPINLDTALDGKREYSPSAKLSPAAKNSPSPREGSRPSPLSKTGKGRVHEHEEDTSASAKWWKLVKRISTGGLREKFTASDAPPPVPALPPNLKTMPVGRTTMDMSSGRGNGEEVGENGVLLRRFMQSRSSLSGVRPNLSSSSSKTPSSGGSPRASTANGNSARSSTATAVRARASTSGHRPSVATRSSSPGSSDMATSSMSNHYPTSSTRSSFSSYGEEIPPVPKAVGQYIISPSELSLMTKSSENPRSAPLPQQRPRVRTRSRSHTAPPEDPSFEIVNSSFEDSRFPSLPLPPRRATTGAAGSPVSTSFTIDDALSGGGGTPAHAAIPPPLGEFGLNEPPPRPRRSARRAAPPNVEVPARSQSMSTAMPPTPQTPRGPPQVRVDVSLLRRPSTGALSYTASSRQPSATSPHPHPSASAPSSAVSASQKRSPLTYREMESPRRVLTEKEKADKWEDLLERSARAGGTLHLGQAESRLMSEQPAAQEPEEVREDESFFDSYYSDA